MSLSILSKSSTVRVAASFFGLCQKGSAAALMVVFCLLSFFFFGVLALTCVGTPKKRERGGGMQSSELRWTLLDRDQKKEVATEERGATDSIFPKAGRGSKKAICAPAALCLCVCGMWQSLEINLNLNLEKKKKISTSFRSQAVLDRATGCKSRLLCHQNWGHFPRVITGV